MPALIHYPYGMELMTAFILCVAGYMSGSVLFAPLVCRLLNAPPPHLYGSHNPGTTNVYRIAGPGPALLTLVGDAFKGWLPVMLAVQLNTSPLTQAAVALCAIMGHMVPLFSRFRGGKGVATTAGAGLAMAAATTLTLALVWLLLFRRFRIASLASIGAAIAAPFISYWLNPESVVVFIAIAVALLARHHDNIRRLFQGHEHSF